MIDSFTGKYAFLSNFHVLPNGITLEHYYQASKTNDKDWQLKILEAETPGKAKRLGKQAPLAENWELIKDALMLELVRRKFSDSILACDLVATLPHILVEGNNWGDTYWGVCDNVGENRLGIILMQVRAEIVQIYMNSLDPFKRRQ